MMARPNSPTTDAFWDLPARQLRAELEVDTDLAIATRYGVHRMVVWRIRRDWGMTPQPGGKPEDAKAQT